MTRRVAVGTAPLVVGLGAWAYGVSRLQVPAIGPYGLLAAAGFWVVAGLLVLLGGFVVELLRGAPRGWVLGVYLAGLIVAIHAVVPIVYGTPEYAWVYKHIGIAAALGRYGHVTDPSNIYQQWPVLFAAAAAVAALSHVGLLTLATWAPIAFELADALLLLGIFRLLTGDRRIAWLAVLLFEGLVAWVGQDYLSPQAFGYLLWLGVVLVVLRWLRAPAPPAAAYGRVARMREPLLTGLPQPPEVTTRTRMAAVALVGTTYFAIVAAHQLTPYVALAGIGALTLLGVVRPAWLLVLLAAIAGGYLIPRYDIIGHDFGGLFSGGNPFANASGVSAASHAGAETTTALIVRGLAAGMWLLALAAIARERRALGRVAVAAALAFSPFVVLGAQRYGGEAIYRVYLFSAPWCALLIARALWSLRAGVARWLAIGGLSAAALFAGLQGLYGPVRVQAVTAGELSASAWLYSHVPSGSVIVLPANNFPVLQSADYEAYPVQIMPSDPQYDAVTLDEADQAAVQRWIFDLGYRDVYIVVSRSMGVYASYFGAPSGFAALAAHAATAPGWTAVYRTADATIYRVTLAEPSRASAAVAPAAAAPTPASTAKARVSSPRRR